MHLSCSTAFMISVSSYKKTSDTTTDWFKHDKRTAENIRVIVPSFGKDVCVTPRLLNMLLEMLYRLIPDIYITLTSVRGI
jgi:hypothetical protein